MSIWKAAVVSIHVAPAAAAPMQPVPEARAVPGRGLEGDRYHAGTGTYSKRPEPAREVTLVEEEAVLAVARDYGYTLAPGATRRNILTRGVPLNHLVGREFQVGGARLRGIRLCEPCGHLASLTDPSVQKGLVHRGGLRAQVVAGGLIRVGDDLERL
ncbi:MAG TPA: MOSC domain-containing protein [Candidatus Saccharimonadales bacterium]|nr:MOSC domain-containing protein [Candidatus Saccharimonadales bacterium]